MTVNKELDFAWEFVNNTNQSVFLTGKAGTGKTTFLYRLKTESLKRMVVVAPTGVAAINAKGTTIHSFFQLPFGPILPNEEFNNSSGFNRKLNKTKINIIKSMDLLVIDEISMVRADLLDAIDSTLRKYRNRSKVFGGVQVLMIGDLQQLSPVVRDDEWFLLNKFYKTVFFFSSKAFQESNAITIGLKKIYRQEDSKFINILNEIRNNNLSDFSTNELNKRFLPNFEPKPNSGYIIMTTHNSKAKTINKAELDKLNFQTVTYNAKIDGTFPEFSYPNSDSLELKVGAQVMFIKNDTSPEKRYFNGKIGKVIHLDKNEVVVQCPDDNFNITTTPEVWEHITYNIDAETKAIKEDKIGSFTQMPLRLAWAITIHKSQGLTIERAIIDAEGAFAHGQTYVALSRCKSLDGLVLKSKINSGHIINDEHVISFNKYAEAHEPDSAILDALKKEYQLDLIFEIFDFHDILHPLNRVLDIFYKNRTVIHGDIEKPITIIKNTVTSLLKISHNFKVQLTHLLKEETLPELSTIIQERFLKAIAYFKEETNKYLVTSLNLLVYTTDNKVVDKDLIKHIEEIENFIDVKLLYFNNLEKGFVVKDVLSLRVKSIFKANEKSKKVRKQVANVSDNLELFEQLRALRNDLAEANDLVHYQIFTQKALYSMCETLPLTETELLSINGMGKTRVEKYGKAILDVIKVYCEDNGIETSNSKIEFPESKPKKVKVDTKKISLELFKSGKHIEDIADERGLTENTIFGHLASFIDSGDIKITDLISVAHYEELIKLIPTKTFENLSDLKHQLDEKYSYAEIRLVLNKLAN